MFGCSLRWGTWILPRFTAASLLVVIPHRYKSWSKSTRGPAAQAMTNFIHLCPSPCDGASIHVMSQRRTPTRWNGSCTLWNHACHACMIEELKTCMHITFYIVYTFSILHIILAVSLRASHAYVITYMIIFYHSHVSTFVILCLKGCLVRFKREVIDKDNKLLGAVAKLFHNHWQIQ